MVRRKDPLLALIGVLGQLLKQKKQGWSIVILLLLVLFAVLRFYSPGNSSPEKEKIFEGVVVRVADGDTLTVRRGTFGNFEEERVRLYGVDAPEMGQSYGPESKEWLMSRAMGRPVKVERENTDQYGRLVGKVYVNGEYINLEAIRSGMAWYYRQYAKGENDLLRAEGQAKRDKAGLWKQARPQTPWEYRKKHRN